MELGCLPPFLPVLFSPVRSIQEMPEPLEEGRSSDRLAVAERPGPAGARGLVRRAAQDPGRAHLPRRLDRVEFGDWAMFIVLGVWAKT